MNMWGKNKKEDENIKNFTVGEDRQYDLYLAEFDCEGSIAHAKMLSKTGFLKDLSVIELLFTQGPQALFHLQNCTKPSN